MKLTGKALEQLKEYLGKQRYGIVWRVKEFDKLHPDFRWGVMQSFADSVGSPIEVGSWHCMDNQTTYFDAECGEVEVCDYATTRQEAQDAALEKFNEILNNT